MIPETRNVLLHDSQTLSDPPPVTKDRWLYVMIGLLVNYIYSYPLCSRLRRCDTSSPVRNRGGPSTRPTRYDTYHNAGDYFSENSEKLLKYSNPHKTENSSTPICSKHSLPSESRTVLDRTKSLPQTKHRSFTKPDSQRHIHKSTRHKRNFHPNDPRNMATKGRSKEPKFASPYDQHFQEAMYLRLRELQRQGAFERRRAVGARDSDDADDDSDCNGELDNQIKHKEPCAPPIYTTNGSLTNTYESTKSETDRNHCPVAVEAVHHHHYIYHNGSYDSTVTPNKLAVGCVEKAVKSIKSDFDHRNNPSDQSHHIHYHHYHLADTSWYYFHL